MLGNVTQRSHFLTIRSQNFFIAVFSCNKITNLVCLSDLQIAHIISY